MLAAGLPTRVIRDVLPYLRSADVTHLGAAPGPVLQALCREAASLQTRIDELAARRQALIAYAETVTRTTSA